MGAIRSIISRFTSGGSKTTGRTGTSATSATRGGHNSKDAKIGKAVRTAAQKLTGKR